MAKVMAFAFSSYSSSLNRVRKPFNPLLGETYEYSSALKDHCFRFVGEQVSHHPPISAFHCESPDFLAFGQIGAKMTFWGKSLEFKPKGEIKILLKK